MLDDKYVVFKKKEWAEANRHIRPMPEPLEDAVVIRCQDVFAPPALDAYGNAILCVIEAMKKMPGADKERMEELQDIADYFHRRASDAWQVERKLPD